MQRVDRAAVDGPSGRDERLAGDLTAEDPLAVLLRAPAAEDVHLELTRVNGYDALRRARSALRIEATSAEESTGLAR